MSCNFSSFISWILEKRNKVAVKKQSLVYAEKYISLLAKNTTGSFGTTSIVFSKDRAMQLHAFIASHADNTVNGNKLSVLYKASVVSQR